MRHAMGIAVFFGMLGVTLFGLMLTPVFYVLLRKLARTEHITDKHGTNPHMRGINASFEAQ
jgi:multidrug efflux pump